jgi:hypothetical protein
MFCEKFGTSFYIIQILISYGRSCETVALEQDFPSF